MKEKVLFIAAMVGSFSAAIVLLLNNVLEILGVEAGGYVGIINIVGTALALIILVVGVFFLNRYSVMQQKATIAQNDTVTSALTGSSDLIRSVLPKLAGDILDTAEKRSQALLKATQDKVDTMMNEMLPELAKQTMHLVTEQSQSIVEQTTAKASAVMTTMDELIPTYAKRISDQVAQTVRENNAHYHKMLSEIQVIVSTLSNLNTTLDLTPYSDVLQGVTSRLNELETNMIETINTTIYSLLQPTEDEIVEPTEDDIVEPTEDEIVEPTEDEIVEPTEDEIVEPTEDEAADLTTSVSDEVDYSQITSTQSDETEEKSDETRTE